MNDQFKFSNKRISTLRGVAVLILFVLLIIGGILMYWQMAKKEPPFPSVEFFLPAQKKEIKGEKKITEGKLFIIQSNPSSGQDGATDMAIDSEYIYIVGYEAVNNEKSRWRIEKRDKVTGELVLEFGETGAVWGNLGEYDVIPYSIAIDENSLYIVGEGEYIPKEDMDIYEWRIEKRNKITGDLVSEFGKEGVVINSSLGPPMHDIFPMSIVVDSNFLYVGGNEFHDWDMMLWRIERRDKVTGALATSGTDGWGETSVFLEPYPWYDRIHSMVVDFDSLYAVGYEYSGFNSRWAVAKINKTTGSLMDEFGWEGIVTIPGKIQSFTITADESYLYIGGAEALSPEETAGDTQWRIEKRDKVTGALITEFGKKGVIHVNPSPKETSTGELVHSLAIDSNHLYITGDDFSVDENQWRIEKRNKRTGELVSEFGEKGIITTNPGAGEDLICFIKIDSNYIYIGGRDSALDKGQWRIEKRNKITGAFGEALVDELREEAKEMETTEAKIQEKTLDWKAYRNKEYGFEVKYPGDWHLFSHPQPFTFFIKEELPSRALVFYNYLNEPEIFGQQIGVWVVEGIIQPFTGTSFASREEWLSWYVKDFASDNGRRKSKWQNINGREVLRIEAPSPHTSSNFLYYLIFKEDKVYIWHLYPYDETDSVLSKNIEIFNQILTSFKFLK